MSEICPTPEVGADQRRREIVLTARRAVDEAALEQACDDLVDVLDVGQRPPDLGQSPVRMDRVSIAKEAHDLRKEAIPSRQERRRGAIAWSERVDQGIRFG